MMTLIGLNDISDKKKIRLEELLGNLEPDAIGIGASEAFLQGYKEETLKMKDYLTYLLEEIGRPKAEIDYIGQFFGEHIVAHWQTCIDYSRQRGLPFQYLDDPSQAIGQIRACLSLFHQIVNFIIRTNQDISSDIQIEHVLEEADEQNRLACINDSLALHGPDSLILNNLSLLRPIKSYYMAKRIEELYRSRRNLCCAVDRFHLFDDPMGQTLYSMLKKFNPSRSLVYDPFLEEREDE